MSPLVLISIMAGVPIVLLVLLRVNAAIVFLSLCLGSVLVRFAGTNTVDLANLLSNGTAKNNYLVALALLFAPAVFTTIIMIGTVHGKFRLLLNLLPALATGLLVLLLSVPLLAPGIHDKIQKTNVWHEVQQAQVLAISVGSIISLLFLWLQRPKRAHRERHDRHR